MSEDELNKLAAAMHNVKPSKAGRAGDAFALSA